MLPTYPYELTLSQLSDLSMLLLIVATAPDKLSERDRQKAREFREVFYLPARSTPDPR